MNTEQRDTFVKLRSATMAEVCDTVFNASHLNQPEPIEAYWKSKEGKCLACDAEIAVEDQYCPVCTEFLNEVRQ